MKKIMLLCAVLFTLAASAEAQGDTFYVHSVYHNGVVLYKYLEENTKYPDGARCENGRVYVQFVVERDGSITNAHVLKDLCGGCEEEALRVVNSMPKWVPGFPRGKPVRVRFNLLVIFSKK